jgi:GH15 family glucan-1,4-alpha-glucosidase
MLVRGIQVNWQRPDSGIWEVRGGDKHFTYSKVMAWIGVERALRLADTIGITDEHRAQWEKLKKEIEDWIWKHCYNETLGSFVQYPETKGQDATNFMFVLLFFLSRHDAKAKKLVDATRRELTKNELYVYRYLTDDGLPGHEGAFLFCTFWQIAAMAAVGDTEEADAMLKRVEALMPPSGLLSEEIDPATGEFLGNHPQAFSHIGYIMSAYYIHRYRKTN